ncbi:cupin domain-containing protein [Streptacidiphilus sp. P02-A3a]|uniref:cupin domain-containing protein n=1 Tax=Streptacidiphilus sp. P02-A3a TaxID=2704468 RepID=UPI0015FC4608|nr:cupin domain-containing protein [Streptacidiphilus sp. P02-A3a]QMU67348.1 cupin domain-containing protein [Streptacidiphilus sp. P02-A3a]
MQRAKPFILAPTDARPDAPSPEDATGVLFRTGFKLVARDTAGQFSLLEWNLDPWQLGPGLHQHNFDEAFYVLAGQVLFQIRDERHVLGPRQVAWMPRNTPHSFSNNGPEPATGLTISTPGGLEDIFAALSGDGPAEVDADAYPFEVTHLGPPVRAEHAPQ